MAACSSALMHLQALAAGQLFHIDLNGRGQLQLCSYLFVILSQDMIWPLRLRSIHLHGAHLSPYIVSSSPISGILMQYARFNSGVLVFDPSKRLYVDPACSRSLCPTER
jgi:hypothetical protein